MGALTTFFTELRQLVEDLSGLLHDVYTTANYYMRWVIRLMILFPVLATLMALLGWRTPVLLLTLVPLVGFVYIMFERIDPVVSIGFRNSIMGRHVYRRTQLLLGLEIVYGLYLTILAGHINRAPFWFLGIFMTALALYLLWPWFLPRQGVPTPVVVIPVDPPDRHWWQLRIRPNPADTMPFLPWWSRYALLALLVVFHFALLAPELFREFGNDGSRIEGGLLATYRSLRAWLANPTFPTTFVVFVLALGSLAFFVRELLKEKAQRSGYVLGITGTVAALSLLWLMGTFDGVGLDTDLTMPLVPMILLVALALTAWALWKGKRDVAILVGVAGLIAALWLTGTFARWAAAIPPVEASPRIVQRYEPEGLRSAYTCTPREFTVDLNGPDVPSREVTMGFPGSDVPPGCRFTFCYPEGTELQWENRPRVKLTMDHTNSPGMPGRTVFYGPKGGMVVFKVHP